MSSLRFRQLLPPSHLATHRLHLFTGRPLNLNRNHYRCFSTAPLLSLSSFRLCRRKTTSSHFFSPINPKAVEIAFPAVPSPPPTTPNHRPPLLSKSKSKPPPLTTSPEMINSPVSLTRDHGTTKTKKKKKGMERSRNKMGCYDCDESESKSGTWFSNSEGEGDTDQSRSVIGGYSLYVKNGGGRRKMRESVAVEKWSEEPYEDFKRSMLEMILEKEMLDAKDMEELLQCYLCLNSKHHHANIVAAFTEVWELLFD